MFVVLLWLVECVCLFVMFGWRFGCGVFGCDVVYLVAVGLLAIVFGGCCYSCGFTGFGFD